MKPLAPNTLLQNRYLIVHLIGKGGMGEVYLAVDQRLGSAMALKRTFFNDDAALKAAFEREAKILAMLRHPTLPKVSDHFIENDMQYLVMEHISGDDLSKRLEDSKEPFPLSWVLFWADQLLDTLAYLHGHEPPIIHRDIKPQNLKLANDNHIILLDFGLAKNSIGETRHSTSGTLSGYTPHYASMEQIRGTGTIAQSDIYSLSATLYQLLTNTIPPDALSRADNALNNLPDPVKPITEINPEVSHLISDVILKGFSLSIERRYKNAREMQSALREAYSQVQQVMAAQTVAFNVSDPAVNQQIPVVVPQSQMETEYYSKSPVIPESSGSAQPIASNYDFLSSPPASEDIHIPVQEQNFAPTQQENYDATMAFNVSTPYDATIAGEKTEYLPYNVATPNPPTNEFTAPHNEPVNQKAEEFDAGSTVPLINFGEDIIGAQPSNRTEVLNFAEVPQDIPQSDKTEQFQREEIAPHQEIRTENPPVVAPSPIKKKSSSKMFAIIGGLLVFGFIGLAAAAAAVYFLKPEIVSDLMGTSATPSPTPTVQQTVEPTVSSTVEPSVTPTVEPTYSPTVDPSVSPTVQSDVNTDSPNNTKVDVPKDKTPRPQDKTPVPTPTTRVVPTKVPTTTPTKPPPTPTPTKPPTRDPRIP
jgi:serine/threonine protein kinase